jgi:hypothetical protein
MKRLLFIVVLCLSGVAQANQQDGSLNTYNGPDSVVNSNNKTTDTSTSNTYNGAGSSSEIPVGSAITPSYMSNGADTCLMGSGGALQTVAIGLSSGTFKADVNCDRRRDAKLLSDLGMKVAAISRMCQSQDNWLSMFQSGTPCPIQHRGRLVAGKRAYLLMKTNPTLYIPDYGKVSKYKKLTDKQVWYNQLLGIGAESDEDETTDDGQSISDRFRSSGL